jgi:methylmalonyl-CoA mutase cobalamin-binding subunit
VKTVLLAPLDPVHDNAIKLLRRKLEDAGYTAVSMPPGTTEDEVVEKALTLHPDAILVSRTLGYKVAETLGRLVDLAEAAGLRENTRLGVGGMAITREVGAELGFDATFAGDLNMADVFAFIEGKALQAEASKLPTVAREKPSVVEGYTYTFKDKKIEALLDQITTQILSFVSDKTSDGIERARLREEMLDQPAGSPVLTQLRARYIALCDEETAAFYNNGKLPSGVRWLGAEEVARIPEVIETTLAPHEPLQHAGKRPYIFVQYGTGCPVMDIMHIKTAEAWGADGILHFDPSWGAQREGLLEGCLTHEHDGTILTYDNLNLIHQYKDPATMWNVRGHRGLNTAETQILGARAGADLFKINIPYGGTAGGTDPERLTVDGVFSLRLAAKYGLPFDIPGNDELSGVPPHKTFAGILIMMMLGLKLGGQPIPKPLLCYSPYMQIYGYMDDNMVDMNTAKLAVWREIVDTPIWPGEPVGFMTHTPDRVQSAMTTAAHVALAATLGVDAITMASSDEAYSKGPISAPARVDSLRAVRDLLRFMGSAKFLPTPKASDLLEQIHRGITETLQTIADRGDFTASIYEGHLGSVDDGLYPGRTGRGTVRTLK